jgi:biopolymer transport protein ExbB
MQALTSFYLNEWYFALPMTLMSLIAFALVIWRFLLNQSAKADLDGFMPVLQDAIKKKGTKAAADACKEEKGLIPSVLFVAGLEAADQGVAAMRRSMAGAIELEILPRLNFLLAWILAIAKIATMVGLLGTVISMINTFNAISAESKSGNAGGVTAQAGAIGLALFATALGLMTAIPLVFTHVLFKDWIHNFELKMKAASQKLIVLVQNARSNKE